MLRPRIIPVLLLQENGLVKTVNFKTPKYVGDPINAVRIFNEKEVDELAFFDIEATVKNKEPNYLLIEKLASQSRMPLCYGGGVKTVQQAQRIFGLGIEKISLSSAAINSPRLVADIAQCVGSQSVIVVLDVKKKFLGGYEVYTHNGKRATGLNPIEFARELEYRGVGELVINAIDQDGVMQGFDMHLIDRIAEVISIPLTIVGGAGTLSDIEKVIQKHGVIGVAAGSLFVFKGLYKAVLINYPNRVEKEKMFNNMYHGNIS